MNQPLQPPEPKFKVDRKKSPKDNAIAYGKAYPFALITEGTEEFTALEALCKFSSEAAVMFALAQILEAQEKELVKSAKLKNPLELIKSLTQAHRDVVEKIEVIEQSYKK